MPSPRPVVGFGVYVAALPIGLWALARWTFWIPYHHFVNGPEAPLAATIVGGALFVVSWKTLGPSGRIAITAASALAALSVLAGMAWLSTQDICC